MVRVVDCHAGVLGSNPGGPKRFSPWNYFTGGSDNSNPGGPKRFSPWNYFTGGSDNSDAPESASGSGSGLYLVVVDARLSGNKRGKSVETVPFLTVSLLG